MNMMRLDHARALIFACNIVSIVSAYFLFTDVLPLMTVIIINIGIALTLRKQNPA